MQGVQILNECPVEQRRTWLIALMIECPLGEALDDCPATGVRGRSLAEIVKIVGELGEEELDRILRHHQHCLDARELAREARVVARRTGA